MVQGPSRHQQYLLVSGMSLCFYSLISVASGFYFHKFYLISSIRGKDLTYLQSIGRFDDAKRVFFLILMISSALELPYHVGCIVENGPEECDWDSPSNLVFWFFHLIALCGYVVCIIFPCVLWSDMVNKKDGKLIFSKFPYDPIKQFFRICLFFYFANVLINIIDSSIYYRLSDRTYYEDAPTYTLYALIESILSLIISIGCSYCGIKLQAYVIQAKLRPSVELKFLFTLNIIMVIVLLALLGRAIVIFGITAIAPESFGAGLSYTVFTLISRWLPDVFCQACLIFIMRHSGDEIMRRNQLLHPAMMLSPKGSEDVTATISPMRILRITDLSNDYTQEVEHPDQAPALIIAKEFSGQTIESLQATHSSKYFNNNSNRNSPARPSSTANSPSYEFFRYFSSPRRIFQESSIEIENPISSLVYGDEKDRSGTSTPWKSEHFSTDSSLHSRPGDFPATSFEDSEL